MTPNVNTQTALRAKLAALKQEMRTRQYGGDREYRYQDMERQAQFWADRIATLLNEDAMSDSEHRPTLRFVPLNDCGRQLVAEHAELALIKAYKHGDDLKTDLDRLAIQIEALLRERAQIQETLRTFYRAELSASSVQPILELATRLDPTLTSEPR